MELDKDQHVAAIRRFRMEQKDFHEFLAKERERLDQKDEEEEEKVAVGEVGDDEEEDELEEASPEWDITQAVAAEESTPGRFRAGPSRTEDVD